ncbi:divalent-cation tolerance protein CutA [Alteriqipengyuania flavescens]|uniref:divalent-cation tolerance protein CutA n=1 Tax=Alteriqipengyuania flavescens TaxID=3053610 RepID=UPI0025B47B7B|nr:divalent-cation tolerance protein CutA [Alteriqipengyuania flavescens]WJY19621.1 divalent-cation tolerance protein CutA [Alteriqipengyuania flavescens]WJY25561.1 divalent-cation tolerance protein CutA [Alteriqipengyuania flavescens]
MSSAMIWCPFATLEDARAAARELLDRNLVACANIAPGVESLFRREGEVQTAREVGVFFKTSEARLAAACEILAEIHPYDEPAVIGWQADAVPGVTGQWLDSATLQDL